MKPTLLHLCAALVAALPLISSAQDAPLSKQYDACMSKAVATVDMVDCMTAETKRQDAGLNAAYKELQAELNAGRKKQLLEAQRAWIKFRDTNCDFYYDPEGGSLARLAANDCILTMTANRAQELRNLKP